VYIDINRSGKLQVHVKVERARKWSKSLLAVPIIRYGKTWKMHYRIQRFQSSCTQDHSSGR